MRLNERIGRRIKLQDLNTLMTVVQAGSMGKAAQQLNTSQPNISKSIADLERVLGVRLLDRHRQGIEPTEYGRALLSGGTAVFDELRQTIKNIEFLADPVAGEVRIGSVDPLAAGFVTAIIDQLSARHPRMVCHLLVNDTDSLRRGFHERRFDLAVARRFGALADDRLSFEPLFEDFYVIAAGMKSPWVRRRRVSLAELMKESWVLPSPESVPGVVLANALQVAGLDYPRATVVTNSPEARINLLATGRFLTVFSTASLRFQRHADFKALPVELSMSRVPIGAITLKNRTLSPSVQLFIDQAREIAKPLAQRK